MEYKVPPSMEALEKLKNFIAVNRLSANTRIPSERDLCQMWNVSRSTLRQAVDTMVESGNLYRVKGSGVFVSDSKIIRNMSGVDSMLTEMRQSGRQMDRKVLGVRHLESTKQISKHMRIPLSKEVLEFSLLRIIDHTPSVLDTSYIDPQRFPDAEEQYMDNMPLSQIINKYYHVEQTHGSENISITYASADEAALLEIEEGAPLFFASGVTFNEKNEVIMYYKQLLRTDRFKFVSLIEK